MSTVLTNFFDRILGRSTTSRTAAKDRLRLVLLHDRTDISGGMLEQMRLEIIGVLSKYVEIDSDSLEVNLEKEDGSVALIANIPILKVLAEKKEEAVAVAGKGDGDKAEKSEN